MDPNRDKSYKFRSLHGPGIATLKTDTRIIFKLTLDYASEALNQSSGKNINLRVIYREMCPLVHQMFSNIDGGRLARVTCNNKLQRS